MQKPEVVLEIQTHTFFSDIDIQTDHLITARRAYFVIINKKSKSQGKNLRKGKER